MFCNCEEPFPQFFFLRKVVLLQNNANGGWWGGGLGHTALPEQSKCFVYIRFLTHHFHFLNISHRKDPPCKTFRSLYRSNRLFLVRKAVLFQSNQKWWMVGRWMERNATCNFCCVLFISDFQKTHHFHFLMFPLKRTQKRTQVAKFSK